jgi:hypothetical protein
MVFPQRGNMAESLIGTRSFGLEDKIVADAGVLNPAGFSYTVRRFALAKL